MKTNLFKFRWLFSLMIVLLPTITYADEWTWTASSTSSISGTSSNVTLNSKAWTVTRSADNYIGYNASYGIQFGSKNAGAETVNFSSSAFTGTITSIVINCGSYNQSHTLTISVGGTAYSTSGTIGSGSTTADVTATGSSSGTISINFAAGSRAVYVKTITITYSAAASCSNKVTLTKGGTSNGSFNSTTLNSHLSEPNYVFYKQLCQISSCIILSAAIDTLLFL